MGRCLNCMKEYADSYDVCPYCGYIKGTPPKEVYYLQPGTVLAGRYEIGTTVGSGGFGIVYRAWDKNLDKMVAIKEYYPMSLVSRAPGTKKVFIYAKKREEEFHTGLERFLEEARNVARFSTHPNIVNVFNFFEENNTAYCVMEYLDGITFKEYIKRQGGMVSEETAVRITMTILDALSDIHKAGIIHRDIAPDNVMILKSGIIKLMDFGAARFSKGDRDEKLTIVLKPGFAPTEQYKGKGRQGPFTDIYAVGAMLYRAVTGVMPEESTNRVKEECLVAPKELNPEISDNLNNAILRAMAVQPELRFQSTDEFKAALVSKKTVRDVEAELKRRRKRRRKGFMAAAVVLLSGIGIGIFAYDSKKAQTELKPAELVMWVPAAEGEEESVTDMYRNIIAGFTENYPQITVSVVAIPEEEYAGRLVNAAGTEEMPDVYDSSMLTADELSDAVKIDRILKWFDTEEYYGLEAYRQSGSSLLKLPVSFHRPVLYVKKKAETAPEVTVEMLEQAPAFSEEALNAFLSGGSDFLLADSSCYWRINESMAARYQLQEIPEEISVQSHFATCYSISKTATVAEKNAAYRFLYHMLSENAQYLLCIDSHDYGIPLNKNEYIVWLNVNLDFNELSSEIPDIDFVQ